MEKVFFAGYYWNDAFKKVSTFTVKGIVDGMAIDPVGNRIPLEEVFLTEKQLVDSRTSASTFGMPDFNDIMRQFGGKK